MKLESKITALERASTAPAKLCSVTYKHGQGPEGEILLPMEKALQEAKTGHVKDIRFPLTFNEEQAEAIVNLQLYRLSNTDVTTLINEGEDLKTKIINRIFVPPSFAGGLKTLKGNAILGKTFILVM